MYVLMKTAYKYVHINHKNIESAKGGNTYIMCKQCGNNSTLLKYVSIGTNLRTSLITLKDKG